MEVYAKSKAKRDIKSIATFLKVFAAEFFITKGKDKIHKSFFLS